MKMSKVGNQTNSQDPQAVNSRVFVGNLNTFHCAKSDVERMFQRYGRLAGISMHKGYAFVQFTNPFDARGACLGEDGRRVLGQTLDVNMVAEPKAHQTGRKRQNVAKTGNDWDYYYDSYYASTFNPRLVPPVKRPRLAGTRHKKNSQQQQQLICAQIKTYNNPDILICGNCREMFTALQDLLDHKKEFCKLRFTCKCNLFNDQVKDGEETALLCVQCKEAFYNAWDLMVHVQAQHLLNIYELGGGHQQRTQNNHDGQNQNQNQNHQQHEEQHEQQQQQQQQPQEGQQQEESRRRRHRHPGGHQEEDEEDEEEDEEEEEEMEEETLEDEMDDEEEEEPVLNPTAEVRLADNNGIKDEEEDEERHNHSHAQEPAIIYTRPSEHEEDCVGVGGGGGSCGDTQDSVLDSSIMGALNIEPIRCERSSAHHQIIANGEIPTTAIKQ